MSGTVRKHACGVLVVLLSVLLFLPGSESVPFYTKGEPREGVVVWEIYASGEWILPLRNGADIPSKPPLFHWMGALVSHAARRVDELTVRLPSICLGAGGVLLVYAVGVRLWGVGAGVIAAVVLATSFEWLRAATSARVDMTLAFFMVAAFLLFLLLYRRGHGGRGGSVLLALLLALATLAKGPVGVLLPCLTMAVFLLVRRDVSFARTLHPLRGAAVILIVAGSWYALATWTGGERFVTKQIVEENLLRFFSADAGEIGHQHPFYYLVLQFLVGMAPWSLFVPAVALSLSRRRLGLGDGILSYLLVWFGTVFLFYSAASAKRGVYLLPLYPAVALLLGAWWQGLREGRAVPSLLLLRLPAYVCAGLFGLLAAILAVQAAGGDLLGWIGGFLSRRDRADLAVITRAVVAHRSLTILWVVLVCGAAAVLLRAARVARWGQVWGSVAVLMAATAVLVQVALHPPLARSRTFKPFAGRVRAVVDPARPLVFYRTFDYGALFYARRHIPWLRRDPLPIGRGECVYLLMPEDEWDVFRRMGYGTVRLLDRSEGTGPKGKQRLILVSVGSCAE